MFFDQIDVEEIIVHERYSLRNGVPNDIALLRLADVVSLNVGVGVVCLPIVPGQLSIYDGREVTIAGWGRTAAAFEGEYEVSSIWIFESQHFKSQNPFYE